MPVAQNSQAVSQLNIRLPQSLKQEGDATLALAGSSPSAIIRLLWAKLAQGGDAYAEILRALEPTPAAPTDDTRAERLRASTTLFEQLGTSLGLDAAAYVPDGRPVSEILEDEDWERLAARGLV